MLYNFVLPKTAVVWVAKDLFGSAFSWAEAKAALASMHLESALLSMAMVNAVCVELAGIRSFDNEDGRQKIAALVEYLFPVKWRNAALSVYAHNAREIFIPLASQACIAMTEACMRFCPAEGGKQFSHPNECEDFSRVLFSFHDNLTSKAQVEKLDFSALTAEQFRYFCRNYQAANLEHDFSRLVRRHYMMFEAADPNGMLFEQTGRDAAQWFTEVTGVSSVTYRALMLFAMNHGSKFSIESPDLQHLVYDLKRAFAEVTPEVTAAYLRLHALSVLERPIPAGPEVVDWEHAVYGLHHIRRKPILQFGENLFLCLFLHLVQEKFFGATVHMLTELVDAHRPEGWDAEAKKRTGKVRREFGFLFEDYIRFLLTLYFPDPYAVRKFPVFHKRGKDKLEYDGFIICGSTALVFEFVHHPWSLPERASGDASKFIYHIADNVRKAGALALLLADGQHLPEGTSPPKHILPIVICSEAVPINEITTATWERDLIAATSRELVLGSGIIKPVQFLSLTQLELIDNMKVGDSSAKITGFLAVRSDDPLLRFSGDRALRQSLVKAQRLGPFDDAAEHSLFRHAPGLFTKKR